MFINSNTPNWNNLSKGLCPKCSGVLFNNTYSMKCSDCEFKIGMGKFTDCIKGKEATAYRKILNQRRKIKKFNTIQKSRELTAVELQQKERESNLRRMKAKGLI